VAFLSAGSRVGLRTDRERLPARDGPHQRTSLLAFLARVEPDAAGAPEEPSLADPPRRAAGGLA
jgi:hypothetical protein